jgi:hypothetical protein
MLQSLRPRRPSAARFARATAALAVAVLAAACGDDDDPTGDDEPKIISVRLTITPPTGAATTTTVRSGATTAPTLAMRVGTSTIRAEPLDGSDRLITLDEPFEVRLVSTVTGAGATQQTPLGGSLSFTGNGTLNGGTVVATGATSVSGFVRLVHTREQHSDFDAPVTIVVTP